VGGGGVGGAGAFDVELLPRGLADKLNAEPEQENAADEGHYRSHGIAVQELVEPEGEADDQSQLDGAVAGRQGRAGPEALPHALSHGDRAQGARAEGTG